MQVESLLLDSSKTRFDGHLRVAPVSFRDDPWPLGFHLISAFRRRPIRFLQAPSNQEAHHRQKSFREELIELLQRAGVEYDERYLD